MNKIDNVSVYNLLFNGRYKHGQVKGSSGWYNVSELSDKNCEFMDKIPHNAVNILYHGGAIVLYTDSDKTIHVNSDITMVADSPLALAVDMIKSMNTNSAVVEYSGGRIYTHGGGHGSDKVKLLTL